MPQSETIGKLAAALAKAQGSFSMPKKDKTVHVKGKTDDGRPFSYDFTYATLDAIMSAVRGPLSENGLAISQLVGTDEHNATFVETTLSHASGEWLSTCWVLPYRPKKMQEYGSLITYARRYCIAPLLGITAEEDDDGNMADGNQATEQPTGRTLKRSGSKAPPPQKQAAPSVSPTQERLKQAEDWAPPQTWRVQPDAVPWSDGEPYGGYPYPIEEAGEPAFWSDAKIVCRNAVLSKHKWDELLEGSPDGGRVRVMKAVVERAAADFQRTGEIPSAFAARVAIQLRRWLETQESRDALAEAGFDPDAEHGTEDITAADIDKDFASA